MLPYRFFSSLIFFRSFLFWCVLYYQKLFVLSIWI
nr:MAG TPA: hypothetical protein [Caudoviricetes sp.]